MKVSVIIPIYRVEAYIERCARSLMEQTLDEVELIFVDDCSPDNSMAVLERMLKEASCHPPTADKKVRILRHETNRGLPTARNTGLEVATGEYIFHCDSDDYLEPDALEQMYKKAKEADADVVYSDWFLTFQERVRYMRCPAYDTTDDALRGLLHGTMKYNVWNKLVKRGLYNEDKNQRASQLSIVNCQLSINPIRFPDGHGMGEDMTMILLFAKARSVAYLPKGTYHYVRQNENAFTAARSEVSYADLKYNADQVIAALRGQVTESDLAAFKLNVKIPFLISSHKADYERWQAWYPEANSYIRSHQVSARMRLIERCASGGMYLPLKLHYNILRFIHR